MQMRVIGLTLTDIQLTANVNGKPVCILVLPFPSAKSLMDALRLAIEDFEKRSNSKVLDLNTLSSLMNASK